MRELDSQNESVPKPTSTKGFRAANTPAKTPVHVPEFNSSDSDSDGEEEAVKKSLGKSVPANGRQYKSNNGPHRVNASKQKLGKTWKALNDRNQNPEQEESDDDMDD